MTATNMCSNFGGLRCHPREFTLKERLLTVGLIVLARKL